MKISREARIVLVGLGVAAVLVAVVLNALDRDEPSESVRSFTPTQPRSLTVEYDVTGSATSADVSMATPTGIQQESPDVPLMFCDDSGGDCVRRGYQFKFAVGSSLVVSAQKNGTGRGTITCTIRVNGETISENTSTSPFGIASCSGVAE